MTGAPQNDFTWVVPGVLAAMGRPRDTRRTLEFFRDEGIDVIITLTETALERPLVEESGFEYHHIPIRDFCAPTMPQVARFVDIVNKAREAGRKTVSHCYAGRGRTGTMAACYLVSMGRSAGQALSELRALRPGSVETAEQERAVYRYERRIRKK